MKLTPFTGYLLVKAQDVKDEMTLSAERAGLVLPEEQFKELPQLGVVEAIGYGVDKGLLGRQIIFKKYSVVVVEWEKEKCTLLTEDDILAVVEDDTK